jgi:hypothetical protein
MGERQAESPRRGLLRHGVTIMESAAALPVQAGHGAGGVHRPLGGSGWPTTDNLYRLSCYLVRMTTRRKDVLT